jgi:hypothetical protein
VVGVDEFVARKNIAMAAPRREIDLRIGRKELFDLRAMGDRGRSLRRG